MDNKWIEIITAIVTVFAAVSAVTPNTSDDTIVNFLLKLTNFLGLNVGKAKNSE